MKKLLFMAIMLFGISAFAQTDNLLKPYISVKDALISSDSKATGTAAFALLEAVKSESEFAQKTELLKAVDKLSQAGDDLDRQRIIFNDVSVILWNWVKSSGKVNQPVYYQYCPMKKAYWLSKEKDIKNPYYGASMLTCGKVVETKS